MVVTICGNDHTKLNERLRAILSELEEDTDVVELEATGLSIRDLRDYCNTMPLFGGKRVVIVKGISSLSSSDASSSTDQEYSERKTRTSSSQLVKDLEDYLPEVPETTLLVFFDRNPIGTSGLGRVLRKYSFFEEYLLPEQAELPLYIRKAFESDSYKIDSESAEILAQAVSNDVSRLQSEMDKLKMYCKDKLRIDTEDIYLLVDMPPDVAVWDITDAIYAKNAGKAVQSFRALLEKGVAPQQIIGAISSQIRNLVIADSCRDKGSLYLQQATGMKPFVARKLSAALSTFKPGQPKKLLEMLLQVDLSYKTGKAELDSALELFIQQACARRF